MPLAALIAGLATTHLLDVFPPAWCLAASLATTLAACLVRSRFPFLLSLALFFFVWGQLSLQPYLRPDCALERLASGSPVVIDGELDCRPEPTASGGSRVYLQVDRVSVDDREVPASGRLLVYVKEGRVGLHTGDRVRFTSRIRVPRNLGLPGESDLVRRLAYQQVHATAFVLTPEDLVLLRGGKGWLHDIDLLAARLGGFISQVEPGAEGGVLKALLLGDRRDVPERLQEDFARSGVNHILSISGFHVGIVFLSLCHFLYYLARRSEWLALHVKLAPLAMLASLPMVVFYLFLSGQAPATLRSVLMICVVVAALRLKREVDPIHTIMLAACAILFAAPQTLFDISFQLSFLAIWGLSALTPPIAAPVGKAGRVGLWVLLLCIASAVAILATLVHVAYYFQRVSLIGLVANLLVVPLMGYGAVVLGFSALVLSCFWEAPAELPLHLAAILVRWADQVVEHLSRVPVLTGYLPDRLDLLLACLVLCAITFLKSNPMRVAAALPLLAALVVRAVPAAQGTDGSMRVYFLSVGQGDATLVHLPDGTWMLVDGGGNATDSDTRVGARLLLPALRALSVRRIDYLVLSHGHPDHLQGVLYLAANFEVGKLLIHPLTMASPELQQLKWVVTARDIPVLQLRADLPPVRLGGVLLQPLWPVAGTVVRSDANATSLVFGLAYGRTSILFTGDIGATQERELLDRGALQPCGLLKVAHHGSRHSSCDEFLAAVQPQTAVISAGYQNAFHLPAPATLARLQRHGARTCRTDLEGTVEAVCKADGTVLFSTFWGHFN
ncbi:DNA internalization-related competence protein ComEC/Rec2 [Geomonas subterranea]|uniref:DNA internalization-related competence protein ComEC/Rec2 n=1 Tax=Geomonas subterranea TaxID=2847989 RepID=A0ABX8LPH7_9BACT|nr:DNA internalization-related competence protein ComEC/Rec2 [Geomonas subterranea]QXE92881.1 DNA internalization-related competence protein ComEC/Rec2 [Geomonas subterranea]QXM09014.1 DNA internalization-related competence protein ComEC/Rec2 [Geomonas subterranea]